MCGICGIYNYRSGEEVDKILLGSMAAQIVHRGPDDDGFYLAGSVGLGIRRLSIIDIDGGHQPMSNEDGSVWIVFNGEIYNFPDLRRELQSQGHIFRTHSDTETVIHAYEEWGVEAFSRLNGIFGFAIWDDHARAVLLVRDHFGVKPLYYYDDGRRLLFSSEIKAILQDTTISRELNLEALDLYLTFRFIPSPYTLLKGINKLSPGHFLSIKANGCETKRYFNLTPEIPVEQREEDAIEKLRYYLRNAIHRQMISDVPVGAFLSGGIDSTTVVTLMQSESTEPIHTFTVGFSDKGEFNELDEARKTAQRLGTRHHEIILSKQDYIGFWPKAMWHLEEPVVTPSVLPMYYVSKLAREHVKVVMTGQGADEPWAGYRRYEGETWVSTYQHIPRAFRQYLIAPAIEALPRNESLKRAVRALGEQDPAVRFTKIYSVFGASQKNQLYRQRSSFSSGLIVEAVQKWQNEVSHLDSLAQMMYVDTRFSLPDDLLLYCDKMSMAVSLEARVPMLDLELMKFVENLPSHFRLKKLNHKYLYRKAIAAWIPQEVLKRPKRGFDTPMDRWLKGDLQQYTRKLCFSSEAACRNYFNLDYIDQLLKEHASGHADFRRQIFCLLSFELWHRLFIDEQEIDDIPV